MTISLALGITLSACDSSNEPIPGTGNSTNTTANPSSDCTTITRGPLGANETAATIPASIATTYQLTYSESAAGSGIADGKTTEFIVSTDGSLTVDAGTEDCVTLVDPVLYLGNTHEAIWFDSDAGVQYALSSLETGFNEINVGTDTHYDQTGFTFYGQYR
ncbi:hypothetical protein GP5015_1232 [gamma proteobacterium HTCC5015]|nr:hypothetical protein GP5015_1232 [gamma proteobacterium HTCC5015]